MSIQYDQSQFVINGVSSAAVVKTLKDSGLHDSAVAEIVGGWYLGATGALNPQDFHFQTPLMSTDANCIIDYQRSFAHVDWVDGESRVQAGMTPEELGFNARMHAIENEFDAVGAQLRKLGACAGELRTEFIGVVHELESKLTAIQNAMHTTEQAIKPPPGAGVLGTVKVGDKMQLITKFDNDFQVVDFKPEPITKIPEPGPDPAVIDPHIGIFDPALATPESILTITHALADALTQPAVTQLFSRGPVTVGALRQQLPNLTLSNGTSLGSVIATLPAETSWTDVGNAISGITEHLIGALPAATTAAVKAQVLRGDAAGRSGAAILDAGVGSLGTDEQTSGALAQAGLGTIGALASADPVAVRDALTTRGITMDASTAAALVTRAKLGRALGTVGGIG